MWNEPLWQTTKVTLELREIVESGINIWDFDYPSFYEGEEKTKFEQKVIDHYYFRQIGQETVGRFLHYFRTKVREIMPYYIQLYDSEKYMKELDDPFATVDYTETYSETREGQSSGSASSSSTTTANSEGSENLTHKFSNTPQGEISNLDRYMTEASQDSSANSLEATSTGSGTNTNESESSETVSHTLTKKGAMGVTTFGHDMIEFRQSFLNVDMMVIDELNDLFLKVY